MARAREYKRLLDAINTSITDISRFNGQEILIKQEPVDKDDADLYDTCIPTIKESEDIKSSNIPEDNISWKENVCSQSESFCNITTISNNQIAKKSLSVGHVETGNRKYIRQKKDSFVIAGNNDNRKRLVKPNDIKRSNRKRKRNISTKMKTSVVYCDICSLPYDSLKRLKFHKSFYSKTRNYFCSSCFSYSCSHIRLKINSKISKSRYCCHFCERMFNKKKKLQSHLFHIHGKEIGINVEDNSFSINHSTVSYSDTLKKKRTRQKTMMEYIVRSDKENGKRTSDNLNNSNVNSALTIIKQEAEWMDDKMDQSSTNKVVANVSRTEKSNENTIQNQPFVKIHVDSNMMKALLGISNDDDSLEKSFLYSSNINSNRITNSINSKPYSLRSLTNSIKVNNNKPSTNVRKNNQSDSKLRKLLSMCKKCTILLVRCDDKFLSNTTSNSSQFAEASSQVSKAVNRKFRERRSSHRKSDSNELPSKNCFPRNNISQDFIKNNSSVRSPVKIRKRITKSKPNSSITLNSKLSTKFKSSRKKRSGRRRSLLKQILLDRRKNESLEKADITNPGNSSTQKESDPTKFQNERSANAIAGLKEVKVSLVKLPEIKKEMVVPEINENATASTRDENFPCTICKALLNSKRRLKKHTKKYHTVYISSICQARYASKRLLLKHYLQEHDTCVRKCCVCYQFFNSRLSLKRHLLLHCIKVTLSKNDLPPSSKNIKCYLNVKRYKYKKTALKIMLRSRSTERQEIDDINRAKPKEILNVSKIENLTNQVSESEGNNDSVLGKINDRPGDQAVSVELTNPFKSNNTEVSPSRNNDLMEEPIPDGPYAAGESIIYNSNEDQQIELISHTNLIQPGVCDNNESIPEIETTLNKQKYPCSVCGKQFKKQESLFKHERTYSIVESLDNYCYICGLFFSSKMILKTHVNTTHNSVICSLYKLHCQFCNQGFRIEKNLLIHELHYHANAVTINDKRITDIWKVSNGETGQSLQTICSICGLFFNTYERYQLHCTYYYKSYMYECTFCHKLFHGLHMLHCHKKRSHHYKDSSYKYKYKCLICCEEFSIESHFLAHKLHVHASEDHKDSWISKFLSNYMHYNELDKSYECSKCNIQFSSKAELRIHVEYYSNYGNYQCLHCSRKCYTLSIMHEHVNLTHNYDESMDGYKCNTCGEILMSNTSLLCHQKHVHSDANTKQVSSVTYKYTDKVNRIIPEKLYFYPTSVCRCSTSSFSDSKKCNISCPICAVNFEKEVHLKEHLAEYLNFGDYQCNKCQRRFTNLEFLKKHVKDHLAPGMPVTKYCCTVCNENCKSFAVLESHVAHLHARVIFKDVSPEKI